MLLSGSRRRGHDDHRRTILGRDCRLCRHSLIPAETPISSLPLVLDLPFFDLPFFDLPFLNLRGFPSMRPYDATLQKSRRACPFKTRIAGAIRALRWPTRTRSRQRPKSFPLVREIWWAHFARPAKSGRLGNARLESRGLWKRESFCSNVRKSLRPTGEDLTQMGGEFWMEAVVRQLYLEHLKQMLAKRPQRGYLMFNNFWSKADGLRQLF